MDKALNIMLSHRSQMHEKHKLHDSTYTECENKEDKNMVIEVMTGVTLTDD